MENTSRDVNIALANEFALVAEQVGINVWEAIELANHHPRVSILKPGPGVGGHCIAVDPRFIVQAALKVTPLIQAARRVNDAMPAHVVELVKRALTEQRSGRAGEHGGKEALRLRSSTEFTLSLSKCSGQGSGHRFSKARIHSLGWEAKVSLKEGIGLTYPWIEAQVRAAREAERRER